MSAAPKIAHADWCAVNNYNAPYPCNCQPSEVERVLERFRAAVRLTWPNDMTPSAKRIFESILEEEARRASENKESAGKNEN